MLESKSRREVDRISAEWAATLATLGTVIGRLETLSSLRDPHTGRYVHHGMAISVGNCAHDVLLRSHMEVFADWQTLSLREQMRDLKNFVMTLRLPQSLLGEPMDRKSKTRLVLETWTELESYRNFIPISASKLDRELFLTNLSSIIAVLRNQLTSQARLAAGS